MLSILAVSVRLYPSLGHSLYPAPSRFQDLAGPMDLQPKADLATWALAWSALAALPRTGSPELPVGWLIGAVLLLVPGGSAVRRRLVGQQAGRRGRPRGV